jgi:hypothetical protein
MSGGVHDDVRHLLEGVEQRGEVAPLIPPRFCALERLVGTLSDGQLDLELPCRVKRKLDVRGMNPGGTRRIPEAMRSPRHRDHSPSGGE